MQGVEDKSLDFQDPRGRLPCGAICVCGCSPEFSGRLDREVLSEQAKVNQLSWCITAHDDIRR